MYSWAQRMHRRAATLGSVVTSCGHPGAQYPHRLEKVKFGVPLEEVCKNDIPGPLLVLILKLNKEAPFRKDVFRAPGNQGAMKKLIHFLQQGRLVNVDNYSVYTIASVLKKFLRKLPGGVFGREGEAELFQIVDLDDEIEQREKIHRLLMSLPGHTQRLLVLLFGTFRVIASNSERADTGMTSEALGVSVAPSFFQSCVSDGKTARMKDVLRFKVATKIMKQMIEQFTDCYLFGRVNYEYYVRVTGRVLRVQDEWICSFRYPPPPRGKTAQQHYALKLALQTEKTWLQCECERWGLMAQEESHSTPALLTTGGPNVGNSAVSLGIIPEHSLLESCARLSVSLEGPGIFNVQKTSCSSSSHSSSSTTRSGSQHHMTLEELQAVNRYAESTKSLSYLPQVHERQAARMRTRSEWFLGARGSSLELCHDGGGGGGGTGSLIHPPIVTSTPIPGTVGHHPHGIIGTYASIDNLNDLVVVVVDVNQDQQSHKQYDHNHHDGDNHRYHHNHHPDHQPHHHHHHHDNPTENSPELAGSNSEARQTHTNNSDDSVERSHDGVLSSYRPPNPSHPNDNRGRPSAGDRSLGKDSISDSDDGDPMAIDETDGDEHDFAISQGHHFDQRAENRRRRRRRALLRRGSYDQIVVSSGSVLPSAEPQECPGVAGGSTRPGSAPVVGRELGGKRKPTNKPQTPHQGPPASQRVVSAHPATYSPDPDPSAYRRLDVSSANDESLPIDRSGSRRRPSMQRNRSHSSATLRSGSSRTISRQSNLSAIVFSVLDFLF
ncbi:uncharacterized protein LOC128278558 [Anopheles cruzii]|uniref:uncharacterized protein LOC128278558 n=1 Tax=Anopheles cruzii TaxID=68878 RepID=UPI0022EC3C97|nr:uncharacterized protein LOC128278558 [Anopheles cruzii]